MINYQTSLAHNARMISDQPPPPTQKLHHISLQSEQNLFATIWFFFVHRIYFAQLFGVCLFRIYFADKHWWQQIICNIITTTILASSRQWFSLWNIKLDHPLSGWNHRNGLSSNHTYTSEINRRAGGIM